MSVHVKVGGTWLPIGEGGPAAPVYGEANEALSTNVTFKTIREGDKAYRVATFTTTGSLVMTVPTDIDYLMIGGGGGSGANYRNEGFNGGGAGYPQTGTGHLDAGTFPVVVGTAGRGSDSYPDGGSNRGQSAEGLASTFNGLTAEGGGRGGGYEYGSTKNAGAGAGGSGIEPLRSAISGVQTEYGWGPQAATNPAKGSAGGNGGPLAGVDGIVIVRWEIEPPTPVPGFPWAKITALTGSPKRYDWTDADNIEWSTFEWTAPGTATTEVGVIDTVISGGQGGGTNGWGGQSGHPGGAAATKAVTSTNGDLNVSPGGAGAYSTNGAGPVGGTTTISGVGVSLSIVGGGGGGESGGCCPGPGAGSHFTITGVDAVYGTTGGGKALIRVPKQNVTAESGWV